MLIPRPLRIARWLLPLAALITLAACFGPWVPHRAAGLVVSGLDLGEYVKFLVPVQSGQIRVWREGFYLPLVTVSLALSLCAYRREFAWHGALRALWLALAAVAALNMLPPAWTPAVLRSAEFRVQMGMMLVCLVAVATSPLLALFPRAVPALLIPSLGAATLLIVLPQFWRVRPAIEALYNQPLRTGWGLWLLPVGLALLAAAALLLLGGPAPRTTQALRGAGGGYEPPPA